MDRSGYAGAVYSFFAQDLCGLWQQHLGILPWAMVAAVAEGVLGGLSHLHGHDIIHRDIKPANTLVRPSPHGIEVVISDSGWCKTAAPGPSTPGVVTLPYRAPEIELGCNSYSFPVDVWSVGIMLAELCACKSFASQSWRSRKPQHSLLIAIDGLSGPICEDEWPGLSDLTGWIRMAKDVIYWRKGQPRCPHPFNPCRRLAPEAVQDLTNALLMLRPEKRCSAKGGHAQAVKFLSDVAPRHVARRADPHTRPRIDVIPQVNRIDDVAPRHVAYSRPSSSDAASQTKHAHRRYLRKRPRGPLTNFNMAILSMREATACSGGIAPASQEKTASAEAMEVESVQKKTESARASAQALEETLSAPASEAQKNGVTLGRDVAPGNVAPRHSPHSGPSSSAAASQTEHVNHRSLTKRPALTPISNLNMAGRRKRARTCPEGPAPASQDRTVSTRAMAVEREQEKPESARAPAEGSGAPGDAAPKQSAKTFSPTNTTSSCAASAADSNVSPLHSPWKTLQTPLPDPPLRGGKKSKGCMCTGRCSIAINRAHERVAGSKRSSCRFLPANGSKFCDLCRCRVPGCTNVQVVGQTCRRLEHLFAPYDQTLKALVSLRVPLSSMDPVDLQAFLRHAPVVRG